MDKNTLLSLCESISIHISETDPRVVYSLVRNYATQLKYTLGGSLSKSMSLPPVVHLRLFGRVNTDFSTNGTEGSKSAVGRKMRVWFEMSGHGINDEPSIVYDTTATYTALLFRKSMETGILETGENQIIALNLLDFLRGEHDQKQVLFLDCSRNESG